MNGGFKHSNPSPGYAAGIFFVLLNDFFFYFFLLLTFVTADIKKIQ